MKRVFFIVLLLVSLFGGQCYAAAFYTVEMVEPIFSKTMVYSDENIAIGFSLPDKEVTRINFTILNRTNEPIKVDWNKFSFVTLDQSSLNIYHAGILYADAIGGKAMKETVIPPRAKINDFIGVTKGITAPNGPYIGWGENYMFPTWYDKALPYLNGKFGLFMPLEINGKIKNYYFTFMITNIEKEQSTKPYFGIDIWDKSTSLLMGKPFTAEKGVLISGVAKGGPSEQAGIRINDIIVGINDKEVHDMHDFEVATSNLKPKNIIVIKLMRGSTVMDVKLLLGERSQH